MTVRGMLSLGTLAAMHAMVNAPTLEERLRARAIVREALGAKGRANGLGGWWRHAPAWNAHLTPAQAREEGVGVGEFDYEHARRRNAAKARRRRLRAAGAFA